MSSADDVRGSRVLATALRVAVVVAASRADDDDGQNWQHGAQDNSCYHHARVDLRKTEAFVQ